jgi:signal transduction histidine kinase
MRAPPRRPIRGEAVLTVDPAALPYDELPDGVLVAGPDGRVTIANTAACRILGVGRETCLGRDYREVLPLTDEHGRDWWGCTDPYGGLSTRTRQPERRLATPAGLQLLVTASYVRGDDRRLERLVVGLRDTAVRDRLERGAADLVSTVAHELRSPLTSVKGFTATLLAKWERFTDEQKRLMLATVNADADRVTRLLSELLDVSRIDAGRLELRRQVVDVPGAVRKAFAGHLHSGEPEERFVLIEEGPLPDMWLDPDKIDQVIGNLVENAVRHGRGTVTVTLGPNGDGDEPGALLTIGDEGPGIPEDARGRVFGKFWRANRRGGTGLGLYIVKGLIDTHGGTIRAEESPAGGAQFRVELPAGRPPYSESGGGRA